MRDEINRQRRELPWEKVEKSYTFQTGQGEKTLAELFGDNSQLIVYHFMLGPGWDEGCTGCSFISDHFDAPLKHIVHHDVSLVVVSRATLPEIQKFKKRMGWEFDWVSSSGSDFNYDYYVSFHKEDLAKGKTNYNYEMMENTEMEDLHGTSVFYKDESGRIFHTYSHYARGGDLLLGAHNLLDLTPKGRNEKSTMDWVRLHDQYDGSSKEACCTK